MPVKTIKGSLNLSAIGFFFVALRYHKLLKLAEDIIEHHQNSKMISFRFSSEENKLLE